MALDSTARLVLQFELVDKATQQATQNLQKIQGEAKKTNSELQKGAYASEESLRSLERSMQQVSRSSAILGAAIAGPLILASKSAAERNYELFKSFNAIQDSTKRLTDSIGVAMVPVIQFAAQKINDLVNWWTNLDEVMRNNIVQSAAWTAGILLAVAGFLKLVHASFKLYENLREIKEYLKPGGTILAGIALMAVASSLIVRAWERISGQVFNVYQRIHKIAQVMAGAVNPIAGAVQFATNLGKRAGSRMAGGSGAEDDPYARVNLGSIIVHTKPKAKEALDDLGKHAAAIADQIGSKFKMMADTYIKSLQGIAGITMTVMQTAIDGVSKGLGDSVAQAIVYGKNFAESMKAALQSLAASIISFLVTTIAKIVVLRALGVVGPISSGALGLGGGPGSSGGGDSGGGGGGGFRGFIRSVTGFASGGIISEPVAGVGLRSGRGYTIGERGPEMVSPLTGRGSGGGGNITNNFTINGNGLDAKEIAYEVSRIFKRETMRLA